MISINNSNLTNKLVNGISHLKDPSAVLPTLMIEACCTSGRTYQSYKRGGALEAKERFREEATSAVFWLWGVKAFNKIGDIIGEKVLKLKDITVDVGKDSLRDPFYNIDKTLKNKTAVFKFGKIISSVLLATGFMGFVVPKINHAITAAALKNKQQGNNTKENIPKIDDFISQNKGKKDNKYNKDNISFGSGANLTEWLMKASYNLENNNTARLISTDAGMVAGRVANSRHPAEAFEYMFRDISSIYFYNFATANLIFLLNKLAKTPDAHPKVIVEADKYLKEMLNNGAIQNLSGNQLKDAIQKGQQVSIDAIQLEQNGTIKLNEFLKQLKALVKDKNQYSTLEQKAKLMSELQPLLRGEAILSEKQVQDIFSDSITSNPTFLKKVLNEATGGRALDKTKFISRQATEKIRSDIDGYVSWVAKQIGEKEITEELINKAKRSSLLRTGAFQAAGMIFSAFGLAILIPKIQMHLSQRIYGKKSFEEIANGKNKKAV